MVDWEAATHPAFFSLGVCVSSVVWEFVAQRRSQHTEKSADFKWARELVQLL